MSKFDTGASQKTAFLTGASSGIGKAAALALIKEGYRVIGTSRSTKPDELRDGIRMIACDVTSDESVAAAVALARAELGHIDMLVNNAGFGVTGAAEESSVARVHALFDTNFYGVVRMHQCGAADHAPTRTWPDSEYRLDTGAGPAPYGAYYSASKFAIEGYSESLDHEVREFGVRVAVIEPWATRTAFEASNTQSDRPIAAYAQTQANYRVALQPHYGGRRTRRGGCRHHRLRGAR